MGYVPVTMVEYSLIMVFGMKIKILIQFYNVLIKKLVKSPKLFPKYNNLVIIRMKN